MGRGPEADPEAAKPDDLVPKSCLHFILFHQRLTMRTHCHSRRSAILLLMYLYHAVYSNPKLRSTRSLNSDWPDNLMARRAESFDWSTCMHAQRQIPIICLGFEAVLSHSWSCQKGFVLLTTAFLCLNKRWKIKGIGGREIILRDVCGKLLSWVNQFLSVVDVIVRYDPVHSSLPWAGIRLFLQVSKLIETAKVLLTSTRFL